MNKLVILLLLILPIALSAQSANFDFDNFDPNNFDPNNFDPNSLGQEPAFDLTEQLVLPSDGFGSVDPDTGLPPGIEEQISVTITPKVPLPRERVTILIESFSSNLNKANIVWSINGEVTESGIGLTEMSFVAPNSGGRSVVKVEINKEGGGTISKEYIFAPADVDIIWEAKTYTPPFYRGKSLFTRQSTIVFVAIPNFVNPETDELIPAEELVYTWKKGSDVLQDMSGYGKSTLTLTADIISRPAEITVTVTAIGTNLAAKKRITVGTFDPEVVLYENNPLYGIMFEKALQGKFMVEREEMEISAVPYHFTADKRNTKDLQYKWFLNNKTINTYDNRDSLVFRKIDDSEGIADVTIKTNHLSKFLQASDARFSIVLEGLDEFGEINNSGELEDFSF